MKTLYLDCSMGAAGDMLAGALAALLPEPEAFVEQMNGLGLPGVQVELEPMTKCGIAGSHFRVRIHGQEEGAEDDHRHDYDHHHHHDHDHDHDHDHHDHDHHHDHGHHHGHGPHDHRGMGEIGEIVSALPVSAKAREDILGVYTLIAQAESQAHGVPVTQIHFHEVGAMDAIADITAVCLLMERLAPEQVVVSPVHVGSGHVPCAHGILPVPAPATAYLLRDVPIYGGAVRGELCTPTGAALLKRFATAFGDMPVMKVQTVGYGMGKKDFPMANCVRAMMGLTQETGDEVLELQCNLDDMTGEELGFALERILEAGAVEAFTAAVGMKKSRPGVLVTVLCPRDRREPVVQAMFRHTSTIGIRQTLCSRYVLSREAVRECTRFGEVSRKESRGWGVCRSKYEYEDLAAIARREDLSIAQVRRILEGES